VCLFKVVVFVLESDDEPISNKKKAHDFIVEWEVVFSEKTSISVVMCVGFTGRDPGNASESPCFMQRSDDCKFLVLFAPFSILIVVMMIQNCVLEKIVSLTIFRFESLS
jgi:hypothetical protein